MQTITSITDLKNAIQLLEVEQTFKEQLLKEQVHIIYKSFKPINLLKNTFSDVVSSPYLIDNILGTAVGLATGYLSKKIVVGASSSIIRKLLGSLLQVGVSGAVSQHSEGITALGQSLFQRFFRKKEVNSKASATHF